MKKVFHRIKKKVKAFLFSYAKGHPRFRRWLRRTLFIKRRNRYRRRQRGEHANAKQIIFSSFAGRSYSDSPKALYEYMLANPAFQDYTFVWAFRRPEDFAFLAQQPRTSLVRAAGKAYETQLMHSKFWLMNYRVADHIFPEKSQVYVQLWHGTPLKRLGYDIETGDNAMNSKEEIQDKYRLDAEKFKYLLAPSPFAAKQFASAWNLHQTNRAGCIIIDGYPRNDILTNYTEEQLLMMKAQLGLLGVRKKIILYAPTWRDNQHTSGVGYTYTVSVDFDRLRKELEGEYIILFRAHYLVANGFDFERYAGFVYDVSGYDDINHLYLVSDLLVTDYSSVFFDYTILNKPVIFYMYDLEAYAGEIRGFYLKLTDLPGPVVQREQELLAAICAADHFVPDEAYKAFRRKFNTLDDGRASERVALHTVLEENRRAVAPNPPGENI